MNDQPQRMLRIFFNGGYSDSVLGEDFSMEKAAERLMKNGYIIVANGEGYFPASEIKAMFIYRAANPPQTGGDPNVIIFPKPAA
jgi:hypothetical protein